MLNTLPPVSVAIWLFTLATQFVLCWRLQHSDSFPLFRIYSCWYAGGAVSLFLIASWAPGMLYFVAYYLVVLSANVMTLLVAYEVYMAVFGPRAALPRLVPERTGMLIAMAFSSALALGVFLQAVTGGPLTRMMVKIEQVMTSAAWAAFLVLWFYSLSLRIAWPRRVAGLALGFVLYLSVDVAAVFVRARGGKEVAGVAGMVGQVAYLLTLMWWSWVFWRREPVSSTATAEQVEEISVYHRQSIKALALNRLR